MGGQEDGVANQPTVAKGRLGYDDPALLLRRERQMRRVWESPLIWLAFAVSWRMTTKRMADIISACRRYDVSHALGTGCGFFGRSYLGTAAKLGSSGNRGWRGYVVRQSAIAEVRRHASAGPIPSRPRGVSGIRRSILTPALTPAPRNSNGPSCRRHANA